MGRARAIAAAIATVFVGASAVGVGVIPAQSASALVAPPPLPVALSSSLATAAGSLGTAGAASTAAAPGVAAGSAVPVAGQIAAAGAMSFFVTAQTVGFVTRVAGGSTQGLCVAGSFIGSLYGQDCSGFGQAKPTGHVPNSDASAGYANTQLCLDNSAQCVTVGTQINAGAIPDSYGGGQLYLAPVTGQNWNLSPYDSYGIASMQGPNVQSPAAGWHPWSFYRSNYGMTGPDPLGGGYAIEALPSGTTCTSLASSGYGKCDPSTGLPKSGTTEAVRPGTNSANPVRYFETVATWSTGATTSGRSKQFQETDETIPQFPEAPTVSGAVLVHMTVTEWMADRSASKVVLDSDTSQTYQRQAGEYPDCATGACKLQVYVNGKPCAVGVAACADWLYAPENGPNDFTCRYGTYVVDLAECNVLGPYYNPQRVDAGQAYGDPNTGEPTGSTSKGDTSTETGTQPSSDGQDCFGNVYGTLDPLGWVTRPVQCALQWAFVPTDVQTSVQTATDAWDQTSIVRLVNTVGAWNINPTVSGCSGIPYDVPLGSSDGKGETRWKGRLLDACSAPMSTVATLASTVVGISAVIGCIVSVTRSVGGVFAFPGVAQGSGKDE